MWSSPEDEQDDELSSEILIRLKNQRRLTTLKILSARKVVVSMPMFAKRGLKFKLSAVLPKTLCSLVYQEFVQYRDNQTEAWHDEWTACALEDQVNYFAGLDQFDCHVINLKKGLLTDSSRTTPFLKYAEESAPKLKSFKDSAFWWHLNFRERVQLPSEFFSLHAMSSLVLLEIKFYPVRDADLQVIGLCLPMLQNLTLFALITRVERGCCQRRGNVVKKPSIKVSSQGLEYLKNLTQLKHLTLIVDDTHHHESVQLVKNCLELMPQVNTVGTSECYRRVEMVIHEFPSYKEPVELGLEHLVLGVKSVIPPNVTVPNVTRITVVGTLRTMVPLQTFKKLRHLAYFNENFGGDWSQLQQTLSQVGHLLKILDLRLSILIDLKQVLQSCPNLEKLKLHGMLVEDNFHDPQWKNCVQKLKTFKQDSSPTHYAVRDEVFFKSPGLLQLLLTSCPELEKLRFHAIKLSKAELDLINGKFEADAISIQKLQDVVIWLLYDQDAIVSLAEFSTKMCVKNCNIFKCVIIGKFNDNHDVAPELKVAEKLKYYISNKRWFVDK